MNPEVDVEGYPPDEDADTGPLAGPGRVIVPRSAKVRQKAQSSGQLRGRARQAQIARGSAKKAGKRILAQEKRRKALELRKAGASYAAIAAAVGYADASGARKAVERAISNVTIEPVLELRTLQIERLNHMLSALWSQVNAGNTTAMNTALNIMNKLDALMGTEVTKDINVSVQHNAGILVIDGNKDDFIAGMKRMAGIVDPTTGENIPAITAGPSYPPGMGPRTTEPDSVQDEGDVVDAEVIEDDPQPDPQPVQNSGQDSGKKFDFSVKPKPKT